MKAFNPLGMFLVALKTHRETNPRVKFTAYFFLKFYLENI